MTRKRMTSIFTVSIALGLLALCASPAQASFTLTIEDTDIAATLVTIVDNGIGDLDAAVGIIVFSGPVGGFTISVQTALSKPAIPETVTFASLDLLFVAVGKGTLEMKLTDTGFTATPVPALLITEFGGTTGGTAKSQGIYDPTNAPFGGGAGETVGSLIGPLGSGAFSGSAVDLIGTFATPYSLTIETTIVHASTSDVSSGNTQLAVATPEPASLAVWAGLAGLGLLGAGWRKRRKQIAA